LATIKNFLWIMDFTMADHVDAIAHRLNYKGEI